MQNRYVIYSALVGQYDNIQQPHVTDSRFDFILFSNEIKTDTIGIWEIRPIPYTNDCHSKIARWVKTHPEELLPEYEASLWVDANIVICNSGVYDFFIKHYESNTPIATMKHSLRNCVYDEMFTILCCRFEHENVTLSWGQKLRQEGYPINNGLCETGVFYRRHCEKEVHYFDQLWWDCINGFSRRDQFSVNYALWKIGIKYSYFISETETVYNSVFFSHCEHEGHIPQQMALGKNEAWLIRYCSKCPKDVARISKLYYQIYEKRNPHIWAYLWGQYFRILYLLRIKNVFHHNVFSQNK